MWHATSPRVSSFLYEPDLGVCGAFETTNVTLQSCEDGRSGGGGEKGDGEVLAAGCKTSHDPDPHVPAGDDVPSDAGGADWIRKSLPLEQMRMAHLEQQTYCLRPLVVVARGPVPQRRQVLVE